MFLNTIGGIDNSLLYNPSELAFAKYTAIQFGI